MPRFYLHQVTSQGRVEDPEGANYIDLEEAIADAVIGAREIMAGRMRAGREPDGSRFEIVDEGGRVLGKVKFEDAADGRSFDEQGRPRAGEQAHDRTPQVR